MWTYSHIPLLITVLMMTHTNSDFNRGQQQPSRQSADLMVANASSRRPWTSFLLQAASLTPGQQDVYVCGTGHSEENLVVLLLRYRNTFTVLTRVCVCSFMFVCVCVRVCSFMFIPKSFRVFLNMPEIRKALMEKHAYTVHHTVLSWQPAVMDL